MKVVLAGCAALAVLFSLDDARAADLPSAPIYKVPPVAALSTFSWTGLYLGIDGGLGWGHETYTDNGTTPMLAPIPHDPGGGIFGGVLGYRYQIGQFVLGVEGSAAWADIKDTVTVHNLATYLETLKAQALYAATGQVGWGFNQTLLYVKGGWAGASVHNHLSSPGFGFADNTQNDDGWTVGAGLDYAVWQTVVLGFEYDHIDLGYKGFSAPFSAGGAPWNLANTSRFTINQVLGRLTYKFNMSP